MTPDVTPDTVSVLPEMEAVNTGADGGEAAAREVLATFCEMLTVYVPTPPLPVPTAVTTVPAAMPGPTMGDPTDRAPDDTELTVSVVPEMEPVRDAVGTTPTTLVVATVCVEGVDTV